MKNLTDYGLAIKASLNVWMNDSQKRKIIIAGILVVALLIGTVLVNGGSGRNKPSGTYVSTLSGIQFAFYEFKGNNVEYIMFGETNKGTFKMVDDTVLITYEDGGKDQFTYNAEADELMVGGAFTLVKKK